MAIGVALLLFVVAIGAFLYAFGVGVARTGRGDNVAVANLFFLQGSAPKPVRRTFLVMFLVCLAITVGTAAWEPFGVLVPMLPDRARRGVGGASRDVPTPTHRGRRDGAVIAESAMATRRTSRSMWTRRRCAASTARPTSTTYPIGRRT